MTSTAVEKFDTITNTNVPTIPSLAKDPAVEKADPYLKPGDRGRRRARRARRPSSARKYNEGSKDIYQAINRILNGASAASVLPGLQSQLQALLK